MVSSFKVDSSSNSYYVLTLYLSLEAKHTETRDKYENKNNFIREASKKTHLENEDHEEKRDNDLEEIDDQRDEEVGEGEL